MNICILGGNVKKALEGEYVGGAEKQAALISNGLASLGHTVFVLESSPKQSGMGCVNGIQVIQSWCTTKGIPGIRSLAYRLPALYKKICQINPEIIYSRGVGIYSQTFPGRSESQNLVLQHCQNSRTTLICSRLSY